MARLRIYLWMLILAAFCLAGSELWAGQSAGAGNGRFAPTRPDTARADLIRLSLAAGSLDTGRQSEASQNRYQRFEPRRPGEISGGNGRFAPTRPGAVRGERLGTVYEGYLRVVGSPLSADLREVESYARDFEGEVKRSLVRKLVVKPVKKLVKVGAKSLWKVAVKSWLPVF